MGARKPAPAGPVPAHLPLQQWPQPGPADPEGREKGWCSPTPVKPPPQGLGRHLPGFLHETGCSGPSPGRGEPSSKLRPFSAWLSGLSGSELEGEVAPRSSRAARAGPLAAQQAVPRNPWEGIRGRAGEGRWGCAGHKHVQSAGCPGSRNIRWGRESQTGVWEGSEVLAPRRRPPAGPPGHKEGIAEALSSQRATVAGFWG